MSGEQHITTEMIIGKYIELRDEVEAITNAAAAQCAEKKTTMATLLAALKDKFNKTGETSVKTDAGTAAAPRRSQASSLRARFSRALVALTLVTIAPPKLRAVWRPFSSAGRR